jgi:hypothetical protein
LTVEGGRLTYGSMTIRSLSALAIVGSVACASVAMAAPLVRPSCGGETKKPPDGTQTPPKASTPSTSADALCGGTKGAGGPEKPSEPPKS